MERFLHSTSRYWPARLFLPFRNARAPVSAPTYMKRQVAQRRPVFSWSARRESNPPESAWEADAIPLGDSRNLFSMVIILRKIAFVKANAHIL